MKDSVKAVVQEPPNVETSHVPNKNTGFPEPLSPLSNTTLHHPGADTSPSACLESADVPVSRTHTRHSSFQLPRIGNSKQRNKVFTDGVYPEILDMDGNIERKSFDREGRLIDEGNAGAENQMMRAQSEGNEARDEHNSNGKAKKWGLGQMNMHK